MPLPRSAICALGDIAAPSMRVDRFLVGIRIVKTRAQAAALVTTGRFRVDGRVIDRGHAAVRVGNVLTFAIGTQVRVLRIVALPLRRGTPAEARACYEIPGVDAGHDAT